jgi:hypothetical protein
MPWSFLIPAAVSLFGSSQQSKATEKAAESTGAASDRAAELQYQMFQQQQAAQEKALSEQRALQEPWRAAGVNALGRMQGGAFAQPEAFKFGTAEFQADPGYAFRLAEGQKALDRSAAARGGLISGGALKAATGYGQEMGSQEFARARERALSNYGTNVARSDTGYNRLASLAGLGQTATSALGSAAGQYGTAMGQAAGQYGTNVGNLYTQQGANQGNALLAGAQARTSAYGDIAKLYGSTKPQFGGLFGGGSSSGPVSMPGYGGMFDTENYMGR